MFYGTPAYTTTHQILVGSYKELWELLGVRYTLQNHVYDLAMFILCSLSNCTGQHMRYCMTMGESCLTECLIYTTTHPQNLTISQDQ